MDYFNVLKKSWKTLWSYKALWLFGILLGLTTFSWKTLTLSDWNNSQNEPWQGLVVNYGDKLSFNIPGNDLRIIHQSQDGFSMEFYNGNTWKEIGELPQFLPQTVPVQLVDTLIVIAISVAVVLILLYVLGKIARYVAETALIRMVSDHDETGTKLSVLQGLRLGWSRSAWRLFLIDLVVLTPISLAILLLFLAVFAPLLLLETNNTFFGVIGVITSAGLFFPFIAVVIVMVAAISLLLHFFHRACVLEGLGVTASISQGFAIVRAHLKDAGVMGVILIGLDLIWSVAMIPLMLLLVPLILVLVVIAAILAGVPALITGALASLVFEQLVAWILAGVIGLPIFILVLASPFIFLGALWQVFKSSTWTYTYRELRSAERVASQMVPELTPSVT